ncbi:5,6-dimethylbenzimidazole synthase [Zoogloea sp.]|uniref:5,6-dimethylbenzimidazole synthase n=1 Tax=Zoogloea sp. TaxID=49181 RepID=UPI001A63CB53|nr:5,6-dimethylbenzimidazole synthase [uncultured Zoogloea sp.]MBL8434529.1 5,6-dimethylbenzimidazole synthase [Zoogloea sp.]MCK6388329.1 5,6-dimethylbenzimidazole synthase [Zoogloea sp.]
MADHRFSDPEIAAVYRAIAERRDMRHFRPDPVDPALLQRLLWAAHHAPSVGFMQPWRFIRVTSRALREQMHALVETERQATARALGERQDDFMRLKVEGLLDAGEVVVVALADDREKHIFGRRTLPEMDLASVACAIQNMWLAARAEGIGLGWVSIFDPVELARLLGMPAGARPVAILCIGHVEAFYPRPMLEMEEWAERMPIDSVMAENAWPTGA